MGDSTLVLKETTNNACPFLVLEHCRVDGFEMLKWNQSQGDAELRLNSSILPCLKNAKLLKPDNFAISDEDFLEAWLNAYQLLRATPFVTATVNQFAIDDSCLGVHLRLTDKVKAKRSPRGISCAQLPALCEITQRQVLHSISEHQFKRIYLAADDGIAKQEWIERFQNLGVEVIAHEAIFDKQQLRQTSGSDFLVDLFALARCSRVIGTTWSGVVLTSVWMRGGRQLTFASDEFRLNQVQDWVIYNRQAFKRLLKTIKSLLKTILPQCPRKS